MTLPPKVGQSLMAEQSRGSAGVFVQSSKRRPTHPSVGHLALDRFGGDVGELATDCGQLRAPA